MYYQITAFGGIRGMQGFSGLIGRTFHFPGPCQTSAGAQVHHLKQSSPNPSSRSTLYPLSSPPSPSSSHSPLLPILSSSSFLRYTLPLPSSIPPSLPPSIPSCLMLSPSLLLSFPLPTSHPLFPLNHPPFPYFSTSFHLISRLQTQSPSHF